MSKAVTIYEVGPRDGLQSQSVVLSPQVRIEFIQKLIGAGLPKLEIGAYVSPKWVPAMAGTGEIVRAMKETGERPDSGPAQKNPSGAMPLTLSVLVPNLQGLEAALSDGATEIAIFTAASDTFCQKNINKSRQESLEAYRALTQRVQTETSGAVKIRGYVSTVTHCPYEGKIDPQMVADTVRALFDMGCYEVSLGETLGRAVPPDTEAMLTAVLKTARPETLAGHFHDTYATALSNVQVALAAGLRTFDSSAGAIGGCPYAPGAAGNVGTEDLVYFLENQGYATDVNMDALLDASNFIEKHLGSRLTSRTYQALWTQKMS